MKTKTLKFRRIGTHTLPLPTRAHPTDAGVDLRITEDFILYQGETKITKTGFAVHLEEGTLGFVVPRSGLSSTTKLRIANSPGTIDHNYRGEVGIIVENLGEMPLKFFVGDRLAQFVHLDCHTLPVEEVFEEEETDRGTSGFGDSGI